jgi:hypothetical protein
VSAPVASTTYTLVSIPFAYTIPENMASLVIQFKVVPSNVVAVQFVATGSALLSAAFNRVINLSTDNDQAGLTRTLPVPMTTIGVYSITIAAGDVVGNPIATTTVASVTIVTGTPAPILLGVREGGGTIITAQFSITYTLPQTATTGSFKGTFAPISNTATNCTLTFSHASAPKVFTPRVPLESTSVTGAQGSLQFGVYNVYIAYQYLSLPAVSSNVIGDVVIMPLTANEMFTIALPSDGVIVSGFVRVELTFLDFVDNKTFNLSIINTNGYTFDIKVTSKSDVCPLHNDILFLLVMPENVQYNTAYDVTRLNVEPDIPLDEVTYKWNVQISYDYTMAAVQTRYVGDIAKNLTMIASGSNVMPNSTVVTVTVETESSWTPTQSTSSLLLTIAGVVFVAGISIWAWHGWVYYKARSRYAHV